jgi:uncharacterized protein with FMN-binding domain
VKIALTILAVIVIAVIGAKSFIEASMHKKLRDTTISDVDLLRVADGTYTGSYEIFPVIAEVKVTVKNHRMAGIELVKHRTGQGAAAEVLPGKVVATQTLKVDAISGATLSSKVILKAIETALTSAVK